eukprot:2558550-Rhodomonas_salina.1
MFQLGKAWNMRCVRAGGRVAGGHGGLRGEQGSGYGGPDPRCMSEQFPSMCACSDPPYMCQQFPLLCASDSLQQFPFMCASNSLICAR